MVIQQSEIHKPRESGNHQIWMCFNALAIYKNKQTTKTQKLSIFNLTQSLLHVGEITTIILLKSCNESSFIE